VRAGTPLLGGKAGRAGAVQPGEESCGETLEQPFSTQGGLIGEMVTNSLTGPVAIRQGVMALN